MNYLEILRRLDVAPLPRPLSQAVGNAIIAQRMQESPVPDEDKILHLLIIAFGAGRAFERGQQ